MTSRQPDAEGVDRLAGLEVDRILQGLGFDLVVADEPDLLDLALLRDLEDDDHPRCRGLDPRLDVGELLQVVDALVVGLDHRGLKRLVLLRADPPADFGDHVAGQGLVAHDNPNLLHEPPRQLGRNRGDRPGAWPGCLRHGSPAARQQRCHNGDDNRGKAQGGRRGSPPIGLYHANPAVEDHTSSVPS